MTLIEPRFRGLFLSVFALFALFGTSMTIIGATLPKILANFHWDYLTAGIVLGAGAVAYFISTFVAGYLVKHWGSKPTILLALTLIVAGLAFFATTPNPAANTVLSALIGLGQGGVEVGLNATILRMDDRNTGRLMNLLHGAFAVGAIVGPFAVGMLMLSGLDWAFVYRGMAGIFVALAALMGFAALPPVQREAAEHRETRERLSASPAYWLSFFALFLYLGVELGVSNWVAEYFVVVFAYPPDASAMLVSLFWLGLLAGRFGVPLLDRGASPEAALVGLSALATAAIALLMLLGYLTVSAVTVDVGMGLLFLAGLGCSIYYPTVMTLVGACFPRSQSQAVGFAATGGGIGSFVFPFLMSSIAQDWGIRAGFATYGVFAAGMTIVCLWLALIVSKRRRDLTLE
ncbi:fucose permease [Roseiarcus fermentans]|uniref:Fucose permease n=1 Tax=Roseiarcus fermentans TaxID=1473586 RepID=A0A366FSN7_9HYPH|nr:MFS transporter [Roseiarcus fermentans]RBP17541.1 fucose permease [Roseiarcus fermentans]